MKHFLQRKVREKTKYKNKKEGMEQFLTFLKKHSSQEQKAWSMIEEIFVDIQENIDQKNFKDLRKIEAELQQFKRTYF